MINRASVKFEAVSENESFARLTAAAFTMEYNSEISFLDDVKTAVSEAVTNCIVHAYGGRGGSILMELKTDGITLYITITDFGIGIEDIEKARTPLFSSKPSQNRAGIGFTVMETFMDSVEVTSEKNSFTTVKMKKAIRVTPDEE